MNKLILSTLVFTLVATAACQKTRDAQFGSGEGENLYGVADYKALAFEVETLAVPPTETPDTANIADDTTEAEVKVALEDTSFTTVKLRASSSLMEKLLNSVQIKARPNFKYLAQTELKEKTLTVFMLSKKTDVPPDVADYAEVQADGSLRIPLLQFAVDKLVNVDLKKNEMGEITSTKVEKEEKNLEAASFFKMDAAKGKTFSFGNKKNLLRAQFFAGEWYYSEKTILPEGTATDENAYAALKSEAKLLKFLVGGDSMRAVEATLDTKNSSKSEWSLATTMIFDIERLAFKRAEDFAEVADTDMKLRERPFVKVNFASARTRTSPENVKLVAVTIEADQISFILEDKSNITRARTEFNFVRKHTKVRN